MHPHFYFVSSPKWIWKYVLTDCLQHKGANVKKLYSSPCEKQCKKTLCFATKGKSCPDICQRLWVPDGTARSLQSPHLVNNIVGPIFPLLPRQACHSEPSGVHLQYMVECSWPHWYTPICGLDLDSGISSHWLTACVCFLQMTLSYL